MIIIDLRDRKILFYLLQDSRQSLKSLGKKVGISRELASYRIRRLINKKIIKNFTVDVYNEKLGYSLVNYYYKFTNISPNIKDEIINFFINNKYTTYVSSIEGIYDFQVEFFMGDPHEFESLFDEIKRKYHNYLSIEGVETWIRGEYFNYPFLLNDKINTVKSSGGGWGDNLDSISDLDFKILTVLAKDSRIPTKKIANKMNSTVSIINYRIKNLIKKRIILSYTINVDWPKIGYRWFHLRINLSDYGKKNDVVKHIRKNPHLIRILKGLVQKTDIHCTFLLKNVEQLRAITEEISSKFPNIITNYQFYSAFNLHKQHYMVPKLLISRSPFNRAKIN
ncbi:winged helix-turn-helix transcriptional regulator [Thermoplasmatota archaeon]